MQVRDNVHDLAAFEVVQAGRRLVQYERLRLANDNRRQRQKLSHAPVEQIGLVLTVEAKPLDGGIHAPLCRSVKRPLCSEPKLQLLAHGGAADLTVGILKEKPHATRQLARPQFRGGRAVNEHAARGGRKEVVRKAHHRGLSGAVRTHEGHELAVVYHERGVSHDGRLLVVGGTDVLELDHASTPSITRTAPSTLRTALPA